MSLRSYSHRHQLILGLIVEEAFEDQTHASGTCCVDRHLQNLIVTHWLMVKEHQSRKVCRTEMFDESADRLILEASERIIMGPDS